MRTLHGMLLRYFAAVLMVTLAMFVMVFELMDVFSNLWRYINHEAGLADIVLIAVLFLPKCVSYALPVALLFAVCYTMGTYYATNELASVFGSGVSLFRFVSPLLVLGVLLSVASFFFEDAVVIDSFRRKNEATRIVLGQTISYSNTNVTIASGRLLYQASYYNDRQQSLSGVTIVERDLRDRFLMRIEADLAEWDGRRWVLKNCRIFRRDDSGGLAEEWAAEYSADSLTEKPAIFRRTTQSVEEMRLVESAAYIDSLRKAGLAYQEPLAQYHRKFSFALTPLIVVLVASSIGGLFKRSFLFLSLLGALGVVVGFYVLQMVSMTLARNGYVSPILGAWAALVVFLAVGLMQLRAART